MNLQVDMFSSALSVVVMRMSHANHQGAISILRRGHSVCVGAGARADATYENSPASGNDLVPSAFFGAVELFVTSLHPRGRVHAFLEAAHTGTDGDLTIRK